MFFFFCGHVCCYLKMSVLKQDYITFTNLYACMLDDLFDLYHIPKYRCHMHIVSDTCSESPRAGGVVAAFCWNPLLLFKLHLVGDCPRYFF